jgi:hypothetical protein
VGLDCKSFFFLQLVKCSRYSLPIALYIIFLLHFTEQYRVSWNFIPPSHNTYHTLGTSQWKDFCDSPIPFDNLNSEFSLQKLVSYHLPQRYMAGYQASKDILWAYIVQSAHLSLLGLLGSALFANFVMIDIIVSNRGNLSGFYQITGPSMVSCLLELVSNHIQGVPRSDPGCPHKNYCLHFYWHQCEHWGLFTATIIILILCHIHTLTYSE